MITLTAAPYSAILSEGAPSASVASCDLPVVTLDDRQQEPSSRLRVATLQDGVPVAQVQLESGGDATGVHAHTGVIADDTLFLACGRFLAALRLPNLETLWSAQADEVTCLGVHLNEKHHCLISHGKLSIARINFDGTLVWQAMGSDVFTEGFETKNDSVTAVDGQQQCFEFDVSTGQPLVASPL